MPTSSQTFANLSVANLAFTNIVVTETDVGTVLGFLASQPFEITNTDGFGLSGIQFAAFNAGVSGANASQTDVFTYVVTSTDSNRLINAFDAAYQIDLLAGLNARVVDLFSAREEVFDRQGHLLASQTITPTTLTGLPVTWAQAQSSVVVRVTLTMATNACAGTDAQISVSGIEQNFGTIAKSQLGSIGDIVFLDTANTGRESGFDAGPGVAGVTVNLLDATGAHILGSTVTGANGRYSFDNLQAGIYEIGFVTPDGYKFTTQGVGGIASANVNSSANQITGITGPIVLLAGQANHNVEAGLRYDTGALSIVKTQDLSSVSTVGETIHYSIAVTNTGPSALTGVQMTDSNASNLTFLSASDTNHNGKIDVGETWKWTAVHTVTQADIDAGTTSYVSSGSSSGSGDHGHTTSGDGANTSSGDHGHTTTSDYGHTTAGDPGVGTLVNKATVFTSQTGSQSATVAATAQKHAAITLTKTEDICKVDHAGQVIHYTITATNSGNATLNNVVFADDAAEHLTFVSASDTNHDGKLNVGETWSWTADRTVTQDDIDAAPSHAADGACIVTASSTDSVGVASGDHGHVVVDDHGHTVLDKRGFAKLVDNQGHTMAVDDHGHAITDDHGHSSSTDDNGHTTISDHGHSTGGDNHVSGPGHIVNTAAISTDETGATCVTVEAGVDKHAALKILKTEDISSVTFAGQVIHYNIAVQNTGNATLTGVAMSDPNGQHLTFLASSDTNGDGRLDLNETWVWTADHTVTAAELSGGKSDDDASFRNGRGHQIWGDSDNASSRTTSNADDGHGDRNDDSGSINGGSGSGFIVNTATVTTDETTAASASVSAVIVKAPTGKLDDDYGEADRVEFRYNPDDTVSTNVVSAGLGSGTGHNALSMAFIEVSTKANAFDTTAKIYYEGTVSAGGTLFADSGVDLNKASHLSGLSNFDGSAGMLYVHIFKDLATFNAHGASVQDLTYDVSGGHGGVHLNDQIASLKLVGYEGMTGHGGYTV